MPSLRCAEGAVARRCRGAAAATAFSPPINRVTTMLENLYQWRQAVEDRLRAADSWLCVSGLFWLRAGNNKFGSGAHCEIELPQHAALEDAGSFVLDGSQVLLRAAPGAAVLVNGLPATQQVLASDAEGAPDVVSVNGVRLAVIRRGKRLGIRMFDQRNLAFVNFTELQWYVPDAAKCIRASFIPHAEPQPMQITNVIGDVHTVLSPGFAQFTAAGGNHRLAAEPAASGMGLFFNFQDGTSRRTTYPRGRFLEAPAPDDGIVILDFHRAVSPPCAYTHFATCPLPPSGNKLAIAMEAGQQYKVAGERSG